jgi:NTE family protein
MAGLPVFAIFEGGGAKGVAHIGAAAACARNDIWFAGVAGASAGALAATLLAVGFSAKKILDPQDIQSNILAVYDAAPVDLLGVEDWKTLQKCKARAEALSAVKQRRAWVKRIPALLSMARTIGAKWPGKGFMTTKHVRRLLNTILRDQLVALRDQKGLLGPVHDRVTFADFDPSRFDGRVLPLKIIGANVTTSELWIFDHVMTPHVEIAEAVAASIAIPGAFEPVEITHEGVTHRFVDGGAVSNMPVWVFSSEKAAFERANPAFGAAPIVGFALKAKPKSEPASPNKDGMLEYAQSVMSACLSGSQQVSQRFVQDLCVVTLRTDMKTFDFEASAAEIIAAYYDGFHCADTALRRRLIDRPRMVKEQLARVHGLARQHIPKILGVGGKGARVILRASIAERFGPDAFRIAFGHNMDFDADDRLILDARASGAPAAYLARTATCEDIGRKGAGSGSGFMSKYDQALVPSTVRSVISVPILPSIEAWRLPAKARPEPCGVLSIDSSLKLDKVFSDSGFMSLLIAQSTLLYGALEQEV